MQKITARFTVYFENPFWVGVLESSSGGMLEAVRIVFGAEPTDGEVYEFLMANWSRLRFSPPLRGAELTGGRRNPKRMQREAGKALACTGIGTKAQQALKMHQAEGKEARKRKSRLLREQEKEQKFLQKQEKRKQKKKGH